MENKKYYDKLANLNKQLQQFVGKDLFKQNIIIKSIAADEYIADYGYNYEKEDISPLEEYYELNISLLDTNSKKTYDTIILIPQSTKQISLSSKEYRYPYRHVQFYNFERYSIMSSKHTIFLEIYSSEDYENNNSNEENYITIFNDKY